MMGYQAEESSYCAVNSSDSGTITCAMIAHRDSKTGCGSWTVVSAVVSRLRSEKTVEAAVRRGTVQRIDIGVCQIEEIGPIFFGES
jgi:hypothetical protein